MYWVGYDKIFNFVKMAHDGPDRLCNVSDNINLQSKNYDELPHR